VFVEGFVSSPIADHFHRVPGNAVRDFVTGTAGTGDVRCKLTARNILDDTAADDTPYGRLLELVVLSALGDEQGPRAELFVFVVRERHRVDVQGLGRGEVAGEVIDRTCGRGKGLFEETNPVTVPETLCGRPFG